MLHDTINRVFEVLKMKNAQFCFTTQESMGSISQETQCLQRNNAS